MPYRESKEYLRKQPKYPAQPQAKIEDKELRLLEYVQSTTPKGNPNAILDAINKFCRKHWMMNVGEDKGLILVNTLKKIAPKTILQLGCYVGFSALLMAAHTSAVVHTIEPNAYRANIAKKIHQHAGMEDRIIVHEGVLQSLESFVQNHGKFDVVFIDHVKGLYLSDFLHLERLGAIGVGTTVFGDNIIYPGSPDYLEHLKSHSKYDSVLYHSYLEYSDQPDAVLVSRRIVE